MIEYYSDQRLITMDLIDLEHCGFDHEAFAVELAFKDIKDPAARWPMALIVNFSGGCVVLPEEPNQQHRQHNQERFQDLIKDVIEKCLPPTYTPEYGAELQAHLKEKAHG